MEQEQQPEQEQLEQEGQDMAKAKAKAKKGKKAYKRLSAEKIEQRRLRVIQLLQMGASNVDITKKTRKEFGVAIYDAGIIRIRKEMETGVNEVEKAIKKGNDNAIVVHEGAGIAILVRNLLDEMRATDVRYIEIDALTGEYHVHQVRVTKGVIE